MDVKKQIEPNLYQGTSQTYRKAVDEGFGAVKWGEPDYDFVTALKHNTDVLAAFKTHRQQNDIAALLLDEKGKLKPFARFREEVEGLIGKYNQNWLTTEYNTAVIRARHAAQWKDFERDADLYPNLKWMETTSPHPDTVVHSFFWNRIWALTDPFWRRHYPGDRWNCKCGLTNTDEPVTDNSDVYQEDVFKAGKPDAGIDANTGLTGEVFTPTHPYVKEAYEGAAQAVDQLDEMLINGYRPDTTFNTRLQVHQQADPIEVEENIATARILLSNFDTMHIQVTEHILSPNHKNPEYIINGWIADAKRIEGYKGVASGFKKAIKQGCQVVVIDLNKHLYEKTLSVNELAKYIHWRTTDFEQGIIKECYIVYQDRAVVITGSQNSREAIKKVIEKLRP